MKKLLIVKEIFDRVTALVGLILLAPLFVLISIIIKLDSKGPIFFVQERVGKDGKIFKFIKFRTMYQGAEKATRGKYIDKDNPYVTRVGRILRRTAIDELPQLINVLKGEMSLVGPRPALPYHVEKFDETQRKRLSMKPGITGWAAVNGRNKLTWQERIKLDVWYVENWSLWLDLKILFKTIWVVIKGEGLIAPDEVKQIDENLFKQREGEK